MKKIYLLLMAMLMATAINAQTTGYNRLKNESTGHYAYFASSGSFAPSVDQESAHGLAGTIAYMAFGEDRVTQLKLQNIDVVNVAIPMMKALFLTIIDEEHYISMRTNMVEMVQKQMGAMGSMVAKMLEDYTYEQFIVWVNDIDTNLYMEKVGKDGAYRLFMVTPDFPLNAGTLNDYLIEKANQFLKAYTGTIQEKADEYLVGEMEGLRPMAYTFISHMRFGDRMYLTEQTGEGYELNFGFANNSDVSKAKANWLFEPVDNDANYFGLLPQVTDVDGNYYTTFVADFPIELAEGMKAFYVTDDMDPANSQVRWQGIESNYIPEMTPVIIKLKGSSASENKVQLSEYVTDVLPFDGNILIPVSDEMGFLLGRTLEEPDPNIYVLEVKEGKVCLASTMEQTLKCNTAYIRLNDTRKEQNPSFCLFLVDKVDGISEVATEINGSNVYYDLKGRRVSHPSKGIYIINGKKVAY